MKPHRTQYGYQFESLYHKRLITLNEITQVLTGDYYRDLIAVSGGLH